MNPRLAAIEPSVIRALAALKTAESIDLGLGEPTLLPQQRFLEAATSWAAEQGLKYTLNAGDAPTRERIAAHYAYPGMTAARNVCMTTGSQEAVYVTIKALLDPALDEILVVEPAFPAYLKMAQLEGIRARSVTLNAQNGFRYDAEIILSAVNPATRLIVIASPANPTGRVMSRTVAQRLAHGLLARPGPPVWLLHDEIYRELTYVGDAGYLAAVYPYTVVTNSLSKSNALTGLRIGWAIAPSPAIEAIVQTHAWVTSTASAFAQRVAYEVFGEPGALSEQAAWYVQRRRNALVALNESGLPFVEPDGAFYACVQLARGADSLRAAYALIERYAVVAIPGRIFGASLEGWLRLSFVAAPEAFRVGLQRIAQLARSA